MEQIPAPLMSTPLEEDEKILDSKVFELESNKKNKIDIKISKNITKITIEGKYKDLIEPILYYSKQSIEEIKKNKYFLMFDNLEEIYEEIVNLIKNNNLSLIEENNTLIISIPLSTTKIKEIKIILYKKEKRDKEKIEDLYKMINNMKFYYNNKINELTNFIQEQNNKIDELNDKIEKQNEQISKLEKINNNAIKEDNFENHFIDSLIINKNRNYISNLDQWLYQREGQFKTKLLFRKSINGNSYADFHRLCDNQGKTLVLIQTEMGLIIGGYTTKNWNTLEKWYKDDKSFLFSLTKAKIFPIKKFSDSIRGSKELGPWFAYMGFRDLGRKDLTQGCFHYKKSGDESFENYNEIIPNGNIDTFVTFFDVREVEIYKIYY